MSKNSALTEVLPGLHATGTTPLPFMDGVVVRTYVLDRTDGPTLVYNSPGIAEAAEEIRALGTPDRLLFTGDSLWSHRGRWEAVVLGESSPAAYADSLELMAGLDFDVVLPWVAYEDAPVIEPVEAEDPKNRILEAARRVRAGARG